MTAVEYRYPSISPLPSGADHCPQLAVYGWTYSVRVWMYVG
jgi:hypothetical protein